MAGSQRDSLRRLLLERRDRTSGDMLEIAAGKIRARLREIPAYRGAGRIGLYYQIGSEIPTRDIIQELLSSGREVSLPKVVGSGMEFREITDFASLEGGSFGTMEPRDRCPAAGALDVILVPAVGMSPDGTRLGYGHGFYDRFLAGSGAVTITPILEKQVVRNIPRRGGDQAIDWIVTEDGVYETAGA